jgi:hypothetical protein
MPGAAVAPERGDASGFELLALLSGQVAGALQQTRLYSQVQQYVEDLHVGDDRRAPESSRSLAEQLFHLKTLSLFSTQLHSTISVPRMYAAMCKLSSLRLVLPQ